MWHRRASVIILVVLAAALGLMQAGLAQAPPGIPGLVSWWQASNTRDTKGGNDGYLINGAALAAGKIGKGFTFDGVDDFMLVPFHPSLNVGAQGSLVFWMRLDPSNPLESMADCQGLVTTDYFMVETSPFGPTKGINFVVATVNGSEPAFHHTSDANGGWGAYVAAGEWHHVAGTYDGEKMQLYMDGQPWGNPNFVTGTVAPMETGSYLAVGSETGRTVCPGCDRYFAGQIDEIAIYNRALSAEEVAHLFRRGGNR